MRVSTGMLHEAVLQNIHLSHSRMAKLQSQISSGQRIERPSDDAAGAALALQARSSLRATEQWLRNVSQARAHVNLTESSLGVVRESVSQAGVLALQGASDSEPDEALDILATQVNSLLEGVFDEANRAQDGIHLFGGTDTRVAPYAAERDANGEITSVTANSGAPDGQRLMLVGEDERLAVNTRGSDVIGSDMSLFTDLIALRDALRSADRTAVAALAPQFDTHLERVSIAESVTGVLSQRIDLLEERLSRSQIDIESARSQVEDIDVAEALVEYQEEQTVLEAALTITSQLLDLTLARYLNS
jgi:flagellar hook-associated protein 3 FlgL